MDKLLKPCAALLLLAMAGPGYGEEVLAPIELEQVTMSFDLEDDADNVVMDIDLGLGPNVVLNGLGWDMTLETIGESWASEASLAIGDTAGNVAVYLSPGVGVDEPLFDASTYLSGDIVQFIDAEITDMVLPDGILRIQFFESYDDVENSADAQWLFGSTVTAQVVVPEPPCPADFNGDSTVDIDDLVTVILDWGTDGTVNGSDVNNDGIVDVDDLIAVISAWGACVD